MTNNAEREAFEEWLIREFPGISIDAMCSNATGRLLRDVALKAWQARAQASGVLDGESVGYIEFLDRQNSRLRRCLGFFASVIKSGEQWSDTCQSEYDDAIRSDIASTPPKCASVPVERLEALITKWGKSPYQLYASQDLAELIAEYRA